MKVAVIALGKIGLPLAVQIASKGHEVAGADISQSAVDLINAGTPTFPGETDLDSKLAEVVAAGRLVAMTDTSEAVDRSEAVVVVVPLMTDGAGTPDFSAMDAATRDIAAGLNPGTLVSYETTLPVGTTRSRFLGMLEDLTGLEGGSGFFLVHSPERVFSGRIFSDLRRYPKLVGGIDEESTKRGVEFYEAILDFDERPDLQRPNGVWAMESVEAAELAKLAETTYRDVNIALANEFARFAEGASIDISEVIEASNSQPFSHIHRPGVAVGGHCIPVYPRFYLEGDPDARVVRTAREVNDSVPRRVASVVVDALDEGGDHRVLILGVAYRGGVKETAYSGAFALRDALLELGVSPVADDPMYDAAELRQAGFEPWDGEPVDAVIVQADHKEYKDLLPSNFPGVRVVYDGRAILQRENWDVDGLSVKVIGRG
jgi:nucleotide sugar dehydrogenase